MEGKLKTKPPCCCFALQQSGRRLCEVSEQSGVMDVSAVGMLDACPHSEHFSHQSRLIFL